MTNRTLTKSAAASSAALLLLLAACGEDKNDATGTDTGDGGTTVAPDTTKAPAKIKLATGPANGALAARENAAGGQPAADTKMAAIWMANVTYVAGPNLGDLTGPRTSWFFPADGSVVTDQQKAALAAAFGLSGEWSPLPQEWGGGQTLGPTDGSGPSVTIGTDSLNSWWFNPGPISGPAMEPCTTSTDAGGNEVTTCPEPVPPANVPDKATAEAKARELFAAFGLDASQFEFEAYADQWGAWVNAWLLLDGQRTPMSMYVGFGAEGAVTGAGGFLARPIQGDQYELVGVTKAIERLNDQQAGWMGLAAGGAMARSSELVDPAVDVATSTEGAGTSGSDSVPAGTAGGETTPPETAVTIEPVPVETAPVQEITVTLTGVKADLTQVWDAEGTVWLLPAYTFSDDQGGMYTVIGIDDAFIELPAPVPMPEPMPEPMPVETAVPVEISQADADTLLGLSEAEAVKLADSKGWTSRVVERDGEMFPATADYRTDRVSLTITDGKVTSVLVG